MAMDTTFVVKYLGFRTTTNLWGIKYTRNPVDEMVKQAKVLLTSDKQTSLALLKLQVSETGIQVSPMPQNTNPSAPNGKFSIKSISYGVQDIVYTRVFAMIVVNEEKQKLSNSEDLPFRCHAFVCDSRETARKLTIALANAFEVYSKQVKGNSGSRGSTSSGDSTQQKPKLRPPTKKFAIDLRPPEEIRKDADTEENVEEDFSEA